jgi:hypothetical protein
MTGSRAWLLVLALIAFPHTEWIQDVADAPGIEGTLIGEPIHLDLETLLVAIVDAALIALVIGRPLGPAAWLVAGKFAIDLLAGTINGDVEAIPGFEEDGGYWVVDGLYAVGSFTILLLTVRAWAIRHGARDARWMVPFLLGTAVAYVADIVAYGVYCDAHACAASAPFAKAEVPALDAGFFDLSAEIITGLLIAIVVEGAFRGERRDRTLRAATVAMLAFAALFCLAATLAAGPEVGAAGHERDDVVQVPLAFVVTVQALVTGFAVLLMSARDTGTLESG